MLLTMPDLKWRVRMERWIWDYNFSHRGAVSWLDPFNHQHGTGSWRIEMDLLVIRWHHSENWEEWDVPIFPQRATGRVHWSDGTHEFVAEATNWYYKPGDVVYDVGERIVRGNGTVACVIYPDEIRTGGTVAWITRNPGNIREGEKFGAYPGKKLHVKKAGSFAIFPDETTGLMAIVKVLRGYGRLTIRQAIQKYAPSKDGNNTEAYLAVVIRKTKFKESDVLASMSDEQLLRMAEVMSGDVEGTQQGTAWARDSEDVPVGIRARLPRS